MPYSRAKHETMHLICIENTRLYINNLEQFYYTGLLSDWVANLRCLD